MKTSLKPLLVGICLFAMPAHAAVYTWTGLAADGDWTNAGNWDGSGVPVDGDANPSGLGFASQSDRIVIDASSSPTTNIPTLFPINGSTVTPVVDVLNGSVTFQLDSDLNGNGTILTGNTSATIGDGNSGNGLASLTYLNTGQFRRGGNFTMGLTINSDGSLIINPSASTTIARDGNKNMNVTLAGGSVLFGGRVDLQRSDDGGDGGNWFDFTVAGSTFTADFNGGALDTEFDFLDIADVNNYIGASSLFRSSTALTLTATDNMDGSFTVTAIPEPSVLLMSGFGVLLLLRRRR